MQSRTTPPKRSGSHGKTDAARALPGRRDRLARRLQETRINHERKIVKQKKPPEDVPPGASFSRQRPTFPQCSIIGGTGLTSVFGMGTGVTQYLWSPTNPEPVFRPTRSDPATDRYQSLGVAYFRSSQALRTPCCVPETPVLGLAKRDVSHTKRVNYRVVVWPIAEATYCRRRSVDVIKRSTVSTALLRGSHPLHMRPINLVVFQGSHAKLADLISGEASRLDAFSGYPCRT